MFIGASFIPLQNEECRAWGQVGNTRLYSKAVMEFTLTTESVEETLRLGEVLGRSITDSLVIAMTGDLGSGKTVFIQGLARGLAVPEEYYVTSPSYTLINQYPGRLPLYHADLYRLAGDLDLEDLELHDLISGKGVVAIEWAERVDIQDLGEHLAVRLEAVGEKSRTICLSGSGQVSSNLLREVKKKLR